MRAEDLGGVALARADGSQVAKERAECRALDPHVRAEQILAVVVEERSADRRLEKRDAALVAGRGPRVLAVAVVACERRGKGREQALDVALDRGRGPTSDERCRVLEDPNELVGQRRDFDGDRSRDAPVRHQEHGDLGVTGPDAAEQLSRLAVGALVVLAEGPVDEDAVDGGIGDDVRPAVVERERFDHVDPAPAQFGGQCPHGPAARRRRPRPVQLVVDDQHPARQRTRVTGDHGDLARCAP